MKKTFIILFIFISVTMIPSCSLFQSEIDSVIDLLPRDSDVPGWTRTDDPLYFKGKDIKNYNRDYNGLGIEKIACCTYQSIDDRDIKIKLEIIKFSDVVDAYGFFSIKRGPGIFETGEINEFSSNTMSIIQLGEYAVYSYTDQSDLLMKKDLKTFSNIPLLYIGQNYSREKLPASLNVLKGTGGYGVLYSRKPYHKFPYIKKIYFTQWAWNNDLYELFYAQNNSFYDTYEIFKKSIDNNYILISSDNIYTAFKKDIDDRYSFISVYDKWIFGCWSVNDFNEGKKVLSEIRSRIEDFKKKGN